MQNILDKLHGVEAFNSVPDIQLEWLISKSSLRYFSRGDFLFKKGDYVDSLIIILEGKFALRLKQGQQFRHVGFFDKYEITGALPYSRAKNATGYIEATENSEVLTLSDTFFQEMIRTQHELTTALVHVMSTRIRNFTKLQQQNEKMLALGKLSAGLAHELNNPSSAVVRGARELKRHLSLLPDGFKKVIRIKMDEQMVDAVNDIMFEHLKKAKAHRNMMELSDLQNDIEDWLENHEIDLESDLAESLAEFDFGIEELNKIAEYVPKEHLEPVINWIYQNLTTEKLVEEIEESSKRINQLVSSVKSYTHMDQAPEKQEADVHTGINNTLTMLNHKIKKYDIEVNRNYDLNIPHPKIFVSEINQVWTNLIDNAIDAMENAEQKVLTIETTHDGDFVRVKVFDSGKGIAEEELNLIFDPFYTTKEVGKGTGIGLDIVRQIVSQHNGTVQVSSKPGHTVFEVCLPLN